MNNFGKNIARLVFAGILIIPLTFFWVNRFHIFFTRGDQQTKVDFDTFTISLLLMYALLIAYQFCMVVLDIIAQKSNASIAVKSLANRGLIGFLIVRYNAIRSADTKSKISFTLCGSLVFFFISILMFIHVFDKQSLLFYDIISRSRINAHDSSTVVYYFNYFSDDNNTEKYLVDLFKLSKDFKSVGVKAVVADWPVNIKATDSQSGTIVDSLLRDYNVVFSNYPNRDNRQFLPSRRNYPAAKFHLGFPVYSTEDIGDNESYFRTIVQWYPYRIFRYSVAGAGFGVESDVALPVAEKYLSKQKYSIFENHQIVFEEHQIVANSFTVPITSEGIAYSRMKWNWIRFAPVSASHGVGGWDNTKNIPDSLVYHFQEYSGNSSSTSTQDTLRSLLPFEKYFKDKVVVLNWIDVSNSRARSVMQKSKVASIIEATILNQNYKRVEFENYLASFLLITFLGVSFYWLRSIFVLIISFCLICSVIGLGLWLYLSAQSIFDIIYPIMAIVLSTIMFWLLKLTREIAQ